MLTALSNGIEIERGFIEFQEFFFENINKFDFLPPILPSAFAVNSPATTLPTPDFFDDFTTDKGWSFNRTDVINIFPATGTINITQIGTSDFGVMGSLKIDDLISGGWDVDTWSIRAKLQMNATTSSARFTLIGVSEVNQTQMTGSSNKLNCNTDVGGHDFDQGCLSYLGTANDWVQAMHNETAGVDGFGNNNLNLTEPYILNSFIYPEIIYDTNEIRYTVYSDENYQHVLGCTNNKFDSSSGNCDFSVSSNKGVSSTPLNFSIQYNRKWTKSC